MSLCVATVQATYAIDASGEIQALHDNRPFSLPCQALRKLLGCRQTSWAAKGLSGTLFGSPAAVGPPCAPASGKFSGAITSPWTFGRSLHCCVCWRNGLAPPRSSPCEARAFERSSRKKFSLHRLEFALMHGPDQSHSPALVYQEHLAPVSGVPLLFRSLRLCPKVFS